ncbi:26S proteasome non-ATPase regulatory subunit 9 isoform X2 [Aplysia californica]|uniref:26S proteasome non-ATPase regulatory subunit 9 n=1 Tax=Aplysia californica TaxID=6500 RepID=A0ABM0JWX8_APLCA|nr:26S proteasome non-ATPase regulatory subunit 9 isoform X2 [Aplysia californica]
MASTQRFNELCKKKAEIESTIKELMDLLESQKGVGLSESLIDAEGYPRSDIDVYSCRHARHQISCLQNDHVALMQEIEDELHVIHSAARATNSVSDVEMPVASGDGMDTERIPFAVIDRVDPGSPGAQGGLEVGDQLIEFGSVMVENFVNLQTVGAVLQHSKNKAVNVLVLRDGRQVKVTVTPSTWSGPGLLGCNIKPMKK